MSAPPAAVLRQRLEDRADLLDATRVRYRALRLMLRSFLWRGRLRRNGELLRQVAQAQPEVDRALDSALRRADAEGWPRTEPLTLFLHDLQRLREEVAALAAKRLDRPARIQPLEELLVALESMLAGPRKILPGQKWATALEVLPPSLPELRRASELGDFLERLFKRPLDPRGPLPFSAEDAGRLHRALPETDAQLQLLWRRLHQCDPSGGLLRFLQRRARRAPVRTPRSGPELLLRAAFWHDLARARLREIAEVRLHPVPVAEAELVPVIDWLVRREEDPGARLAPEPPLGDARAGLLELAYELWQGARQNPLPPGRRRPARPEPTWGPGYWERLLDRARRADADPQAADADRVREALRLFVRIRERARGAASRTPAERPAASDALEAWVERARALAAVAPLEP